MIIDSYSVMMEQARMMGPAPVAVAAADEAETLASLVEAQAEGIITPFLVGNVPAIEAISAREGFDLAGMTLLHEPDYPASARKTVALVREGTAAVVVKGQVKTADLLKAVLDRDAGLRDRGLLSHVAVFQTTVRDRLLYVSDSGVVPQPTWDQKLRIIDGAVDVAHRFGVTQPRVAILGANERVDPAMPVGVESLMVARLAQERWGDRAIVEGPMAVDLALRPEVALRESIKTAIPGTADILIVPNVESGNIMCKGMQYFAGAKLAALIVGARAPILINSRADDAETRLHCLAMAVVWASAQI
jgi:phosphate butyryltransferase